MGIQGLNIGVVSLLSAKAALETTGHNIANANTEGYSRQRVNLQSSDPYVTVHHAYGTGVEIGSIERIADDFLHSRLRHEQSNQDNYIKRNEILNQIEFFLNELTEDDLSSRVNEFFNSVQDLVNNVEDQSTRKSLIEEGKVLSDEFNRIDQEVVDLRVTLDNEVEDLVDKVNRLTREIADLNMQIVQVEAGGSVTANANDIRDRQDQVLLELAGEFDVHVERQDNGTLTVAAGGRYLVFQDVNFELAVKDEDNQDLVLNSVVFAEDGSDALISRGRLGSILELRDTALISYQNEFDELASAFIFEFNKIHSTGKGLVGMSTTTSENSIVNAATDTLDELDMGFIPVGDSFQVKNGSFLVNVVNRLSNEVETTRISVDLDGFNGDDTSLQDVVDMLDDVANVSAIITAEGRVRIDSDNENFSFYFSDDSSQLLATLGINGFFSGFDAGTMNVSEDLDNNLSLISGSLGTAEGNNENALRLANMRDSKIMDMETQTFEDYYQGIIGRLGVESGRAEEMMESHILLVNRLKAQRDENSGVSMDEEASNLIRFQRAFQAAAKYISVVDSLLDTLINRL